MLYPHLPRGHIEHEGARASCRNRRLAPRDVLHYRYSWCPCCASRRFRRCVVGVECMGACAWHVGFDGLMARLLDCLSSEVSPKFATCHLLALHVICCISTCMLVRLASNELASRSKQVQRDCVSLCKGQGCSLLQVLSLLALGALTRAPPLTRTLSQARSLAATSPRPAAPYKHETNSPRAPDSLLLSRQLSSATHLSPTASPPVLLCLVSDGMLAVMSCRATAYFAFITCALAQSLCEEEGSCNMPCTANSCLGFRG